MIHETSVPELLLAEEEGSALLPVLCRSGYRVLALFDPPADRLGRRSCDFSDAALIGCTAAPQPDDLPARCARVAAFRPAAFGIGDAERGGEYGWLRYRADEALHLSAGERCILTGCLDDLQREALRPTDRYCRCILGRLVRRTLDYATRFRERQFITRELENRALLADYRDFLDRYLSSGRMPLCGTPDPVLCASRLHLSEAYFTDLLRFETGHTPESYFERIRLDTARRLLLNTAKPIDRIAAELGYPSIRHLYRLLRRIYGIAPDACKR